MSGKQKKGLAWAGWVTEVFDDPDIQALIERQGTAGFFIYFWLCQRAYGVEGYYYKWSCANATTTAYLMGGCVRSETVKETVGACLRIGLFDKRLFDTEGILTSRSIQKTFADGIKKRRARAVIKKYWLLDDEETRERKITFLKSDAPEAGDSIPTHAHSLPANGYLRPANDPKSRVENISSSSNAHAGEEETDFGRVYACYEDRVGYKPSTSAIREMEEYVKGLGGDVVLHALDIALDKGKIRDWYFIRGILNNWKESGLTSLEAITREERRREDEKRERANRDRHPRTEAGGQTTGRTFSQDEKPYLFASYLKRMLEERTRYLSIDEEKLQEWAEVFSTMNEQDGIEWEDMRLAMEYSQYNDFWKTKIITPEAFKRNFIKLDIERREWDSKNGY